MRFSPDPTTPSKEENRYQKDRVDPRQEIIQKCCGEDEHRADRKHLHEIGADDQVGTPVSRPGQTIQRVEDRLVRRERISRDPVGERVFEDKSYDDDPDQRRTVMGAYLDCLSNPRLAGCGYREKKTGSKEHEVVLKPFSKAGKY